MSTLEKQLLHACLSASTYLQGLKSMNPPARSELGDMVLDELTAAIQAAQS